ADRRGDSAGQREDDRRLAGARRALRPGGITAMNAEEFTGRYWASLCKYLDDPSEAQRSKAYELGRHGLADGLGVLDIAAANYRALQRALSTHARRAIAEAVIRAANEFFTECLSPF